MFSRFDRERNDEANLEASAVGLLLKAVVLRKSKKCVDHWKKECSSMVTSRENKQLVQMILEEEIPKNKIDEKVAARYKALIALMERRKRQ